MYVLQLSIMTLLFGFHAPSITLQVFSLWWCGGLLCNSSKIGARPTLVLKVAQSYLNPILRGGGGCAPLWFFFLPLFAETQWSWRVIWKWAAAASKFCTRTVFLGTDHLRAPFSIVVDSIHNIKIILKEANETNTCHLVFYSTPGFNAWMMKRMSMCDVNPSCCTHVHCSVSLIDSVIVAKRILPSWTHMAAKFKSLFNKTNLNIAEHPNLLNSTILKPVRAGAGELGLELSWFCWSIAGTKC